MVAVALSSVFHLAVIAGFDRRWVVSGAVAPVVQVTVSLAAAASVTVSEVKTAKVPVERPTEQLPLAQDTSVSPAGEHYASTNMLDNPPEVIKDLGEDSSVLSSYGSGGYAILMLLVDERGVVEDVREDTSDLPVEIVRALKDEFRAVRFRPGTVNGHDTKFMMHIEVLVQPERDMKYD